MESFFYVVFTVHSDNTQQLNQTNALYVLSMSINPTFTNPFGIPNGLVNVEVNVTLNP